jgi:hypothetical protein
MNETGDVANVRASPLDHAGSTNPYIRWSPSFGGGLITAAVFLFLSPLPQRLGLLCLPCLQHGETLRLVSWCYPAHG